MKNIIEQFEISTQISQIRPLKIGHINDSFIVKSENKNSPSYFLQKINHNIFKDIEGLQRNIQLVTDHLRKKFSERGENDLDKKVLRLIPAKDGKLFYKDENGNYWRIYINIEDTHSYDTITPKLAYKAGKAFGDFQCMLSDIDTTQLIETIPDFHNIEFRLQQFYNAVAENRSGRLKQSQWMVDEIEKRAEEMCMPERLYREEKLVKRINHCDTKVNNLLFDKDENVSCIVDLDTVMPGFVLSDFGDFMRTGANTGAEDDPNLDNININLEIFKAYAKGYLQNAVFLTETESEYLAFGVKLLTYMQTVRFFSDYLNGDIYYKTAFPEHNWQRTKAQFKLLQSQEKNYDKMRDIIAGLKNLLDEIKFG